MNDTAAEEAVYEYGFPSSPEAAMAMYDEWVHRIFYPPNMKRSVSRKDWVTWVGMVMGRPYAAHQLRKVGILLPPSEVIAAMPVGTLGHHYATFQRAFGLDPIYYGGRRHQLHDLFHAVMGYDPSPEGEQLLHAWFLGAGPRISNPFIFGHWSSKVGGVPWERVLQAFEVGRRCRVDPDAFPAEDLLALPVDEVRRRYGVEVLPKGPGSWAPELSELHA